MAVGRGAERRAAQPARVHGPAHRQRRGRRGAVRARDRGADGVLCGAAGLRPPREARMPWAWPGCWGVGGGRPVDRGAWTAKTVKRPRQQPAHPQYANYWAPLTRKRHIPPHPAQPQHTNYWAPRTRKRHRQEHRPQRPIERSDPTQHAKGTTGDCPGPRKGATTRRNVTQGGDGGGGGSMEGRWGAGSPRPVPAGEGHHEGARDPLVHRAQR